MARPKALALQAETARKTPRCVVEVATLNAARSRQRASCRTKPFTSLFQTNETKFQTPAIQFQTPAIQFQTPAIKFQTFAI